MQRLDDVVLELRIELYGDGIENDRQEWDTYVSRGKLDVIRQTVFRKYNCAKSCCRIKSCCCKVKNALCKNLCTCNDCTDRHGKS